MAKRKGKKGRKSSKFSPWKTAKGIIYIGSVAAPMYTGYQQLGGGAEGATGVLKAAAFMDPRTGKFSLASGAQIWTPVAAVAAVDFVTTKLPIQRLISRGFRNILG